MSCATFHIQQQATFFHTTWTNYHRQWVQEMAWQKLEANVLKHKLTAYIQFSMQFILYYRMEKINWRDKITNEDVLKRVDEERSLLNKIWQWKHRRIGHVLRHDRFLQGIFEGRMLGKRNRGRRRMQMLHDLTENSDYATLKQTAAERIMWRHRRGISRTCSTAEDWRERERDWMSTKCISINVSESNSCEQKNNLGVREHKCHFFCNLISYVIMHTINVAN